MFEGKAEGNKNMGYQHLAPTPCIEAGCRQYAIEKGRCHIHKKVWLGSTRKHTLPPDWNTRRQIVLRRDNYTCYICGQKGADTVDHIQQGDDHRIENLAPVHDRNKPHCHRYKTAEEANKWRNSNRIKKQK